MLESLFLIFIGAFVGWSIPQPEWAKSLQSKLLGLLKK